MTMDRTKDKLTKAKKGSSIIVLIKMLTQINGLNIKKDGRKQRKEFCGKRCRESLTEERSWCRTSSEVPYSCLHFKRTSIFYSRGDTKLVAILGCVLMSNSNHKITWSESFTFRFRESVGSLFVLPPVILQVVCLPVVHDQTISTCKGKNTERAPPSFGYKFPLVSPDFSVLFKSS